MWDSVLSDKPLIAAPRELDRPLVLSHSRGLQSKGFSSQSLESSGVVGGFGLQSSLESCAKLPPNLRKILESSGVRIQNAFFVIASGVSRVAIHTKKARSV